MLVIFVDGLGSIPPVWQAVIFDDLLQLTRFEIVNACGVVALLQQIYPWVHEPLALL